MAIPSSQSITSEIEMVSESPPVMPADLYAAAIKGNSGVLIQLLGLQPEEQPEIHQVTIIEADQHDLQDLIGSVTHFGDTLLHLLVTKMHNDLALMVFKKERSLMKARNGKSEIPFHCAAKVGNVGFIRALSQCAPDVVKDVVRETDNYGDTALHCAAKVGNVDFIRALSQCAPDVVKDVVRETDNNGDTALHLAAKHGHEGVACELMKLDSGVAYMLNKEGLSPLYIATMGGYTHLVITMLWNAPSLACEQYSNGMCPVHVAAGAGNIELVMHFMEKYPDDAQLLDHCGQNLFHIAAEKNEVKIFNALHDLPRELWGSLINAKDYEGNTPLHIATIKGHTSVMSAISIRLTRKENAVQNNQGLTPFELWRNQIRKTATEDIQRSIDSLYNHEYFTGDMFDMLKSDQNKWNRIQVIGLGSVLITTVAFAAAFAIPGGYNQDNGTPILGREYMFKAFILANTQSFILAFKSIFKLISTSSVALVDPDVADLQYAANTFNSAAGCMVLAFGLGSYVILAPVSLPIAIIVLSFTILGSPFITKLMQCDNSLFYYFVIVVGVEFTSYFGIFEWVSGKIEWVSGIIKWVSGKIKWVLFQNMAFPLLFIFLLALA